jgi:hypothetical protein
MQKQDIKYIDVKDCAKLMREALKTAFPNTKFSVRISRYAGGHSIDAYWTDGPTGEQVKPILDRFDGQGFDGMTDCSYYCGKRMFRGEAVDLCSGYVFGHRETSAALTRLVADRVAYECGTATPQVHERGYVMGDHNQFVPFQFHSHWLGCGDTPKEFLTMADLEAPEHILASDANGGEYLTRLIDKITGCVSLEPEQMPVELPEYIDENATVETGRADFEEKMPMFAHHDLGRVN